MAINFPPITVSGQTYDYQGIRYTADLTTAPGFWQVTTPGTFGVATDTEIDTGTDSVKYVTPLELEQSKYVRENESTGVTDLDYSGSTKLSTESAGVSVTGTLDVSGDVSANNLQQGLYVRTNETNTYISGNVGTDTDIGIGSVSIAMQRVGRSVSLSGYVEVVDFTQPSPSQNNIRIAVDMKQWLPEVGLTNSTYLTFGTGLVDFTSVSTGDLPQVPCRVTADTDGWLDLFVSDLMHGHSSADAACTFSTIRMHFNVVLYNVTE